MDDQLKGKFIGICSQLEKSLRENGASGTGLKELVGSCKKLSESDKFQLGRIIHVRNKIIHENAEKYSESSIDIYMKGMLDAIKKIEKKYDEKPKNNSNERNGSNSGCGSNKKIPSPVESGMYFLYGVIVAAIVGGVLFCIFRAFIDNNSVCLFLAAIGGIIAYFLPFYIDTTNVKTSVSWGLKTFAVWVTIIAIIVFLISSCCIGLNKNF